MNPWQQLGDLIGSILLVVVWIIIIVFVALIVLALIVLAIAVAQTIIKAVRDRRTPEPVEDRGVNVTPINRDDRDA